MSIKAIPIEFIGLCVVKCPLLNESNDYPQQFILDIIYSHRVFLPFQLETCYALGKIYEQLGSLQAESVVALIDACFSGALRGEGMLASARGIRLKPRENKITGNMVVISAASGDQTALPYPEKSHGLFTYFLLSKLRDSKGDITIGDMADYLSEEVAKQAIVVNKKPQTPDIKSSLTLGPDWKSIKL